MFMTQLPITHVMLLVERNVQFLLQKKLIKANEKGVLITRLMAQIVIPGRFFDSELPKHCHSKLGNKDNQILNKVFPLYQCG